MAKNHKRYVGDGVYVAYDGFGLVLTTEDGYRATNTIWLEPAVWIALKNQVEEIERILKLDCAKSGEPGAHSG